jgi:hypothetical protein
MKIADELAHRALAYVAAVSRQGYPLSRKEFELYASRPGRGRIGIGMTARSLSDLVQGLPESTLSYVRHMRWVRISDDDVVSISRLGTAVLAAMDEADIEPEASVIVAPSEDVLAYAKIIGMVADRGRALLVDPYFRLESYSHVVHYTSVTRLLVGPRADCEELAVALEALPRERELDVRVSSDVHDRFVIPDSGPIDHIGTSLSGLGHRLTVTAPIAMPAADAVRAEVEKVWAAATPLHEKFAPSRRDAAEETG